jgi:hypothetical protein
LVACVVSDIDLELNVLYNVEGVIVLDDEVIKDDESFKSSVFLFPTDAETTRMITAMTPAERIDVLITASRKHTTVLRFEKGVVNFLLT